MATSHLVARLQAALDGDIDLHHFQHARGQFVALGQLLALFFKSQVKAVAGLLQRCLDAFQLRCNVVIGRADVKPVELVNRLQIGFVNLAAFGQLLRAAIGDLVQQ